MCSVSTAHEEEEKSCIGREKFSDLYNRDCCLLLLLCCRAITISLQTQDPNTICIPKYNNRILLHLFRGEIMCYPEYWVNNNECPRKYPQKPIRHKTAQTLHIQWSIILCTKLPLPPHRLELRNKQVREREREIGERSHPERFRLRLWWTPSRCAPTLAHAPSSPQSPS